MKFTVKDIDLKIAAAAAEVEKAKEADRQDEIKKEDLRQQMAAAAEDGNLSLYRSLKDQISALDDAEFVRSTHLRKLGSGVTAEEVAAAWDNYVTDYDKRLRGNLADLEQKKAAFLDCYAALIGMQAEAIQTRERLSGYVKIDAEKLPMEFIPVKNEQFKAPTIDAMAAFYIHNRRDQSAAYLPLQDPETMRVIAVVMNHRSK